MRREERNHIKSIGSKKEGGNGERLKGR